MRKSRQPRHAVLNSTSLIAPSGEAAGGALEFEASGFSRRRRRLLPAGRTRPGVAPR